MGAPSLGALASGMAAGQGDRPALRLPVACFVLLPFAATSRAVVGSPKSTPNTPAASCY